MRASPGLFPSRFVRVLASALLLLAYPRAARPPCRCHCCLRFLLPLSFRPPSHSGARARIVFSFRIAGAFTFVIASAFNRETPIQRPRARFPIRGLSRTKNACGERTRKGIARDEVRDEAGTDSENMRSNLGMVSRCDALETHESERKRARRQGGAFRGFARLKCKSRPPRRTRDERRARGLARAQARGIDEAISEEYPPTLFALKLHTNLTLTIFHPRE